MSGLARAGRIERRGKVAQSAPEHAGADTVLIQFDEYRAELACGKSPPGSDDEQIGPYEEGFAAFDLGVGLADNPYPGDSCAHLHWENGWSQARDEAQRQTR